MHVVQLRLSDRLMSILNEIRELRSVPTIENYFLQLADAEICEFRLLKIQKQFLTPSGPATVTSLIAKPKKQRELSPAIIQKILHLRETEKLNAAMLAQRFGVSSPTILRYLRMYDGTAHVQRQVAPSCCSDRDADGGTFYPKVKSRRRKREVQDA